ncbi:uncharacterized protein JN550_009709 [Neoarthrinium moseri]|uniref:uncharacterized protein n=1 Tax=Neoarthrinium moseri TaxID=1658444 RepID=UPI001FDC35F2|nr:uncharacterized protein JN550_009709 [Neoarthrinium moseri]KAI1863183.1 hypothetical protein JN550_009709 [Neoarthrinium moseri]
MPAQTRARGQPQADKDLVKTYRSGPAEPKQQLFPHRRRHVKTYGRHARSKVLPDQGTLTQMDFVSLPPGEEAGLRSDDDAEEPEGEVIELQPLVVAKKPAKKKREESVAGRSSRRRTMGDVEVELVSGTSSRSKRRKTMGDPPSASSSFHTQTLTQLLPKISEHGDDWKIADSDVEEDEDLDLGLVKETPKKPALPSAGPTTVTPSNRRIKLEIPSSQSPATPLLLRRYSPAKQPSPLKDRSTNAAPPLAVPKSVQKTPREMVIQDSYSTLHSSPVTPNPKAKQAVAAQVTPAKRLRFELPEDKENITPGRTKPKSPKPKPAKVPSRRPLCEVPDSDEELDTTEDEVEDEAENDEAQETASEQDADDFVIPADEDDEADGRYAVGDETQAALVSSDHQSNHELGGDESQSSPRLPGENAGQAIPDVSEHGSKTTSTVEGPEDDDVVEQTPVSTPSRRRVAEDASATQGELYTQGYTQGLESQRVPLDTVRATGPIAMNSDIIISVYHQHVENMVAHAKTHEFRAYRFPESASRVWIYTTKPLSELKYMCILGPPQKPGEIHENGTGNAEFNRGSTKSQFAYEILQMFELNNPVSYEVLKQNGWPAAPQRFQYVPPAIVGQLTSNLRCALWDEEAEQGVVRSSPVVTESQELAEQIRSDIDHATQRGSSEHRDVVPSSQSPPKPASDRTPRPLFARPALPNSHSASSTRSTRVSQSQRSRGGFVRPSQATTVSQISSSSPPRSPEKSVPLPSNGGNRSDPPQVLSTSSPTIDRRGNNSLPSSQFPTRSQLLPDSLLNDDIQEPPPIIWDSADEESE